MERLMRYGSAVLALVFSAFHGLVGVATLLRGTAGLIFEFSLLEVLIALVCGIGGVWCLRRAIFMFEDARDLLFPL